jgi:cytochrome c oxidase subunit 4
MTSSSTPTQNAPASSYTFYVKIWLALVLLTAVSLGVSYLDMKKFVVFTALLIATVKAALVMLYFMHLRHENHLFFYMLLVVFATYAVFIILTFADYSFR